MEPQTTPAIRRTPYQGRFWSAVTNGVAEPKQCGARARLCLGFVYERVHSKNVVRILAGVMDLAALHYRASYSWLERITPCPLLFTSDRRYVSRKRCPRNQIRTLRRPYRHRDAAQFDGCHGGRSDVRPAVRDAAGSHAQSPGWGDRVLVDPTPQLGRRRAQKINEGGTGPGAVGWGPGRARTAPALAWEWKKKKD